MSRLNAGAYEFVPGKSFGLPPRVEQHPQPPPIQRPEQTEAPRPPPTISLSIGGSKPPAAAQPAPAPSSSHPKAPTPAAKPAAVPTPATTKPAVAVKKSDSPAPPSKTFSLEKSKTDTNAIAKEVQAAADKAVLEDLYGKVKEHLNIVFVGHVDAGKSTLGGNLLYICGSVDKRTMEKYEKEAKEAGRETWYLSWALDSTPQERLKGKTVEVGRAYFETDARRYTILDAPGHKTFVPSMISGAAQADIAILVISARKGEFETGFERGGQTREHIMLVKTAGVSKVIIVINKMDDPTVLWEKARYDEIKDKLTPFVKAAGFNPKTDVTFIPVSAYTGLNLRDRVPKATCPWWDGPSFLDHLDHMPMVDRKINAPLMMPISEKYKDMGTIVVGKVESGHIRKDDKLILMPNKDQCSFEAQLAILEHKSIICAGYSAVMHVHTLSEEVTLLSLLHYFDKATGRKSKKPPQYAKRGQKIVALIETTAAVCVETFIDYPQLGRFTLRDEGRTIAIGKITKLIEKDTTEEVTEGVAHLTTA
ncbi:eukaryotic polypeptide chain release factor 3 [Gymnopus androsaceus JB14]|uniref:Eukaryotic peptide chain release factor GTP-binding subunit n=1 Tax=Gymnopus androsaceus JB14 TaxID=1447944 RepID=A0A6A4IQU3_9AGAR|nr:eukaryotic polypeptide chain release factor 3 [Gymnopus androsaceus JB14]